MKQLLTTVIISILFMQTTFASVARSKQLSNAFEDLQFSLAVEWDQKDIEFKRHILNEFRETLLALREDGLSDKEVLEYVKSNLLTKKGVQELETIIVSIKGKVLSNTEITKLIGSFSPQSLKTGSNFSSKNSDLLLYGGIIIAGIIILLVLLLTKDDPEPEPYNPGGGNPCDNGALGYWIGDIYISCGFN